MTDSKRANRRTVLQGAALGSALVAWGTASAAATRAAAST